MSKERLVILREVNKRIETALEGKVQRVVILEEELNQLKEKVLLLDAIINKKEV